MNSYKILNVGVLAAMFIGFGLGAWFGFSKSDIEIIEKAVAGPVIHDTTTLIRPFYPISRKAIGEADIIREGNERMMAIEWYWSGTAPLTYCYEDIEGGGTAFVTTNIRGETLRNGKILPALRSDAQCFGAICKESKIKVFDFYGNRVSNDILPFVVNMVATFSVRSVSITPGEGSDDFIREATIRLHRPDRG